MTVSAKDKKKLSAYGFDTSAAVNTSRRLIMAVTGPEKSGKTTFGLSMPKPMAYFNFDRAIEQTTLDMMGLDESDLFIKRIRFGYDDTQDQYMKLWKDFKAALDWALFDSDSLRSILVDTESDMWELIRLANFGKLTEVMPWEYKKVNTPYRSLLNMCDENDKNVVFCRKLKKQYKNDKWNGKYEPSGMGQVKDIVQVNAEMFMDEDGPNIEIVNNGLNALVNHEVYTGSNCTFAHVAAELTLTDESEWE